MKHFKIITALMLLTLNGCATKYNMIAKFDAQEFAPFAGSGSSSISGQAFLRTRGGEVRYGAGRTVTLIPKTNYSSELWNASLKGFTIDYVEPEYIKYQKRTIADGSGNFEFTNLPAGEYFIECPIFWEVPTGPYGTMETTGSVLKYNLNLPKGEKLKLIMTD
jgi:hypothetical protein